MTRPLDAGEAAEAAAGGAVVRGYLAGSGWVEYQQSQSVCSVPLPAGLEEREQAAGADLHARRPRPRWASTTRTFRSRACARSSAAARRSRCARPRSRSTRTPTDYALTRGIIIADTKFEFGLDENGTLTLMDEVLTPDSSRYWPVEGYEAAFAAGNNPPSYDKQFLRDWLEAVRIDGQPWGKEAPAADLAA